MAFSCAVIPVQVRSSSAPNARQSGEQIRREVPLFRHAIVDF
jgi:hypothetical protein